MYEHQKELYNKDKVGFNSVGSPKSHSSNSSSIQQSTPPTKQNKSFFASQAILKGILGDDKELEEMNESFNSDLEELNNKVKLLEDQKLEIE